jgi:hypothetical protein
MRVAILIGGVTFSLLATSTALADDEAPRGIELGLRSGVSLPLGDASSGSKLSDSFTTRIPIWVDAGYRITPNVYVGALLQYGILSVADRLSNVCTVTGGDCVAYDLQAGLMFAYHFLPTRKIDPWAGIGVGYEAAKIRGAGASGGDISLSGFQFANLQVGADYKPTPDFGFGPFVGFSLASYASESVAGNSVPGFASALHEWITFGVRGVYDISL